MEIRSQKYFTWLGFSQEMEIIGAFSDSDPYYLGSGKPFRKKKAVKRDIELVLSEVLKTIIPL